MVVIFAIVYLIAGGLSFLPEEHDRWAGRAQIFASAVTIPLILVVALGLSEAPATNVTNLFDESLVLATPIALGSMTGLWCERSGIINIGIEGTMLGSAGVGFMVFATLGEASTATAGAYLTLAVLEEESGNAKRALELYDGAIAAYEAAQGDHAAEITNARARREVLAGGDS